jgi:hypothetical protein
LQQQMLRRLNLGQHWSAWQKPWLSWRQLLHKIHFCHSCCCTGGWDECGPPGASHHPLCRCHLCLLMLTLSDIPVMLLWHIKHHCVQLANVLTTLTLEQ